MASLAAIGKGIALAPGRAIGRTAMGAGAAFFGLYVGKPGSALPKGKK